MKIVYLIFAIILIEFIGFNYALSINISISNQNIGSWLNNNFVHYIVYNKSISPLYNFYFYKNGTTIYNIYYPYYYYNSNFNLSNSSTGTEFFLGKTAYPQPFLKNMRGTNFCNGSYTGNSSVYRFFISLCELENSTINVNGTLLSKYNQTLSNNTYEYNSLNTEINNYIKSLVVLTTPKDIFSKLLYATYANYSEVCKNSSNEPDITNLSSSGEIKDLNINYASCQGNAKNYSLPYFLDYYKYINSLNYFLMTTKMDTPQILYYSLLYGIKNSQIFPNYEGPELIESDIALLGVYPGIIPSGYEAEKQLNYSQLLLPINYIKNENTILLENNGINVTSGIYKNITLDTVIQNKINSYSYYNISTNQTPFYGNLTSGPIKYYDSCGGGIGFESAINQEEEKIKEQFYSIMYNNKLYPLNYYQYINNGSFYGPSIIEAVPTNISFDINNVTYGAKYLNGLIAYENSTKLNFTNQTLLEFNIPVNAIKNIPALHQLFVSLNNKYSYTTNFYTFKTNFGQPKTNITNGQYQKTVTYTKNNQTYTETITCYTSSVSTTQSYSSTKQFFASKTYDYNTNQTSYINVSTNMSAMNMFKTNTNGIPDKLNYTFTLYKSSISSKPSYSYITIPPGTDFQIYSPNETLLESFDASFLNTTEVENGSIMNKVYMFGPTWVYPDIYTQATAYYPTYMTISNDNEYKNMYGLYEYDLISTSESGLGINSLMNFLKSASIEVIEKMLNSINNTQFINSPTFQIVEYDHMTQEYYLNGCPYTKIGDVCVIQQVSYTINPNQTMYTNDYNLLNPLLYTQNMYFYYIHPPIETCAVIESIKGILSITPGMSNYVSNWKSCPSYNYNGIDYILVDGQQLNFNTTWKNFTPSTKAFFYNTIENSSTYNNTYYGENASSNKQTIGVLSGINFNGNYSVIYPESYSSSETKPLLNYNKNLSNLSNTESSIIIENNGISFNISKDYDSLSLDECKLNFCFSSVLYPTKVYTTLFYQEEYIGNNTEKISVYPNEYQSFLYPINSLIKENVVASLMNGGYTITPSKTYKTEVNLTAGATFYIKYNTNSSVTSISESGNTIYVTAPLFSQYSLLLNFTNDQTVGNFSNYTFIIPKQKMIISLSFGNQEKLTYWLGLIVIIIVIYALHRLKFFSSLKEDIKRNFLKIKEL
jgi:hypothetical protein